MKTVVEVDYMWALTSCLRYARRQVLIAQEFKEKGIDPFDVLDVIKRNRDSTEAVNRMIEEFGFSKVVAKEIMDMPIANLSGVRFEKTLEYYSKASAVLRALLKEITE